MMGFPKGVLGLKARSPARLFVSQRPRRGKVNMVRCSTATAPEKASPQVDRIVLQPIRQINGIVKLPGSKSLSNRILLLAALSEVGIISDLFS